jgi:hypothetical protein
MVMKGAPFLIKARRIIFPIQLLDLDKQIGLGNFVLLAQVSTPPTQEPTKSNTLKVPLINLVPPHTNGGRRSFPSLLDKIREAR